MDPSVAEFLSKLEFVFFLVFIFVLPIFFLVQFFRTSSPWPWWKRLGLLFLACIGYAVFFTVLFGHQLDHYLYPDLSNYLPAFGNITDIFVFCAISTSIVIAPFVAARRLGLFRPPTRLLLYCAGFLWATGFYFALPFIVGS